MELDPQVRALLKLFEGRPAVNTLPVEVARKGFRDSVAKLLTRPSKARAVRCQCACIVAPRQVLPTHR
jgi:hypothetical protein